MKIGIIGGSGLDDPKILQDYEEKQVTTPFGDPSSTITCGRIGNNEVCILARHGKKHEIPPTQVNYRANIYALGQLGCTHIIASNAVGSLKEEMAPGDLVFPDQVVDFTKQRKMTFHDEIGEGKVQHCGMAEPFSQKIREILMKNADELGFKNHKKATIVVIEGPRFSTKAESFMFRNFADIIGMTTCPECFLAKEAGIEYANVAMSTDYDCWKENESPVTFEMVLKRMEENADKVKQLLLKVIPQLSEQQEQQQPTVQQEATQPQPTMSKPLDPDAEFIKSKIKTLANWPKPGVMFRDINSLLRDTEGFQKTIDILEKRYKEMDIDIIAGIESRGFIIGSILATKMNKPLVLIRKPGKLPFETFTEEYMKEYGPDKVEVQADAIEPGKKVLIVDDLCATGGTAEASCKLIERLGGHIVECGFVMDLPDLGGSTKLKAKWPVYKIVDFEGE